MACRIVTREHWLRRPVEQHVRHVYERAHGATIRSFPDLMVADFDDLGAVRCAAGLRRTADGFFSECYFNRVLEDILGELATERIGRDRIVEVTNLASTSVCSSARLIENIIAIARRNGTDWAVFTITPRLRQLLRQMNLPIVVLGPAQASRVDYPEDWGSYYETRPVVAAMRDPGPSSLILPPDRLPCAASPAVPLSTDPDAQLAHALG